VVVFVEENLLQGVHKDGIRLSVKRNILRRQEFEEEQVSGGRVARNIQKKDSFEVSQNYPSEICLGGIGIIPNCQIWKELHEG
jgi:hypothetical protein